MSRASRISGCLFGLAIGDALAAPTEFLAVAEIRDRFGPYGPAEPSARVTDDTQMTLAVGEALLAAPRPFAAETLEPQLRRSFVAWHSSPENNRAPGMTCMEACLGLAAGEPWHVATIRHSKGCGANMRVAPVGLLSATSDEVTPRIRAGIAQLQAALTHAHPTALAASDLTAAAVAELVAGCEPSELTERLRDYAESQRSIYHREWLGQLYEHDAEQRIADGWDECLAVLDRVDLAVAEDDVREIDPCERLGDGWLAEEAIGAALVCFLAHPDDAIAAVRRAAVTRGDSDSIACLTGALAGAHLGIDAWPVEWVREIEYHDRLAALAIPLGGAQPAPVKVSVFRAKAGGPVA